VNNDINRDTNKIYKDAKDTASSAYKETKDVASSTYHDIKDSADDMINHIKDKATDFYDEGKQKINDMQCSIEQHQDELIQLVKNNPLSSLLVAAGAGYLLSKIWKK
jgi:ElaB/YqjD/DUF883 family membrane-anchored ribosome-binding protein